MLAIYWDDTGAEADGLRLSNCGYWSEHQRHIDDNHFIELLGHLFVVAKILEENVYHPVKVSEMDVYHQVSL